ncbi:MAG TPA: ArdC-like ssDNA-binding domain-containing protein [Solirubrobacteraceae bacterium]|nr:ArdC-like ssDNA-binding domain-containing protein [Solirubrobacteraceae bacterium]
MPRKQLTDEERAARREADRQTTREAVEQLKSTEGWQRWLAVRRHFHTYTLRNQLLIAMQCPEATRVAGFRAWLNLGYGVRKGEQSIRIWTPMPPSKRAIAEWKAAGAVPDDKPPTRFKLGPVFDRSQVDPLPAPAEPVPLDPPLVQLEGDELADVWPQLMLLAGDIGSSVRVAELPAQKGGTYNLETKQITIASGRSVNAQVRTLVHELAHALLRAEPDADDDTLTYAEEELVVESVAYTVCGSLGLDTGGYSIPYLASWSQSTELATIERAAGLIDRLARQIEDAVERAEAAVDEPVATAA